MKKNTLSDNPFGGDSRELCLMLACAVGNTSKVQDILRQPINWNMLLQLATQHQVYPLVYKVLSQLQNLAIPEDVLEQLKRRYKLSGLKAFQMAVETSRIARCFADHGIRAVVLKGAPLAWRLYGDITVRPSKDIDILVAPEDLKKVQDILINEGYQGMRAQAVLTERQLNIFLKLKHGRHFEYLHSEKKIQIEIHWDIAYGLPRPTHGDMNIIEMLDCSISVLTDDEWLLFLIFHGAGHAWSRLRWLVDIALFIQQVDVNWVKIENMAKSSKKSAFLHQTLILVDRLLGVPIPVYFQEDLKQDRLAVKLADMAMSISLDSLNPEGKTIKEFEKCIKSYDAKFRTGWKNKVNHYLRVINPHVEDIKLIVLPDVLFPLYYLIRPITWLRRYYKKPRGY